MVSVNIWAVLVSGIIAMVIGGLWYGPVLGKQWIASMGWSEQAVQEKMKGGMSSMWSSYLIMFIGALLMAYVLARSVMYGEMVRGYAPASAAVIFAVANWLGFVAPATVGGVVWEGKPWKWWFITAGYFLVTLIVMGLVLAFWM
jgi:hypothetical protein